VFIDPFEGSVPAPNPKPTGRVLKSEFDPKSAVHSSAAIVDARCDFTGWYVPNQCAKIPISFFRIANGRLAKRTLEADALCN
jgi:hypothetical protein